MDEDSAENSKRRRDLDAFEKFLDRLDTDRDVAWQKLAKIRTRLIKLFEWRNRPRPVEDADATLDRAAKIVASGRESCLSLFYR